MKEYIVYRGEKFTIEWYFDKNGKSQALNYYNDLSEDQKDAADKLFELMGDVGKIFNKEKFNYEDHQIYAFKPKPDRFLCFFYKGRKIIVTNAFEKKADKMPAKEKEKALKLKADYTKRNEWGAYYE